MHQIIRFHHIDLAGCPQRFYDSVHLLLDDTLQFLMNSGSPSEKPITPIFGFLFISATLLISLIDNLNES